MKQEDPETTQQQALTRWYSMLPVLPGRVSAATLNQLGFNNVIEITTGSKVVFDGWFGLIQHDASNPYTPRDVLILGYAGTNATVNI